MMTGESLYDNKYIKEDLLLTTVIWIWFLCAVIMT